MNSEGAIEHGGPDALARTPGDLGKLAMLAATDAEIQETARACIAHGAKIPENPSMITIADANNVPKDRDALLWWMCDMLVGLNQNCGVVHPEDAMTIASAALQRMREMDIPRPPT